MNISIFTAIWCQNLWDELILRNEVELLRKNYYPERVHFRVFTYDTKNVFLKADDITYIDYFPNHLRKLSYIKKNITNFINFISTILWSEKIIFWWWGLLYDTENKDNKWSLKLFLFRKRIISLFWKKITFYAIWINIKKKVNFPIIKKIFQWAEKVTVRDSYSKNLLYKLWITSIIIPDPVFYDNKNRDPNELNSSKKKLILDIHEASTFDANSIDWKNITLKLKKEKLTVWIALRWGYIKNENEEINKLITTIKKEWFTPVLIPHSLHWENPNANDHIFLEPFSKEHKIKITSSLKEGYEMYKDNKVDVMVAMRLHSIILSLVYNIPFVAISYTTKTREVLKSIK